MRLNADFSLRAEVTPDDYRWVASPQAGVERVMLDRIGAEKARATSLVRYAPESCFPRHPHPGGEEVLVLSGTFSEDDQDYPAGWYMRNPPGSSHAPASREGALIFVKLWQMLPGEQPSVRIDTNDPANWQQQNGRAVCPLFSGEAEQAFLLRLAADERVFFGQVDGAELLVLAGTLNEAGKTYPRGSWLRLPAGVASQLRAGAQGVTVYLKTGHLLDVVGA
jgi:anti-sigma factor ChrR (cupin superfamily)